MKDLKLNHLDKNQRRLLQFGVILIVALFLIGFYLLRNKNNNVASVHNNSVFLQDLKLQVFDDQYTLKPYPDKVLMHYPYLLIVEGDKPLTTIYNLETKRKEKEFKEVLLDYYAGNIIYNKKTSYFNDINLDKYCDSAFYKNEREVLCITRSNSDSFNNMLISIPPNSPNLWKLVYQSPGHNILTTVSMINDDLYLGEINQQTKQNYITINNKSIPVENIVSMIYEMEEKPYIASFKSELNNDAEGYFQIDNSAVVKTGEGKIKLY